MAGIDNDVLYGSNVDFTGNFPVTGQVTADGQLLIGAAVAPFLRSATLATSDSCIGITNGAGTISLSDLAKTTAYVVGSTGARFTSIQTAINQAESDGASFASPANVFIQAGTYTENLTLKDGIYLYTYDGNFGFTSSKSVSLNGTVSIATGVRCKINGVHFSRTSGSIFSCTGGTLELSNCTSTVTTGILFSLTSTAAKNFYFSNCTFNGISSSAFMTTNSDAMTVTVRAESTSISFDVDSSFTNSTDIVTIDLFNCKNITTWILNSGTTNFTAQNCYFEGSGGSIINTGASATGTINLYNCIVSVTSNPVITIANVAMNLYYLFTSFVGSLDPTFSFPANHQINKNLRFNAVSGLLEHRGIAAGYRNSQWIQGQSSLQTSNATPTVLFSISLDELDSITIEGTITAANTAHTNSIGGSFTATASRATAGNVTLTNDPTLFITSTSTASFSVAVDTSTQTIRVLVTGIAATTYNWVTTYRYQKILNNT